MRNMIFTGLALLVLGSGLYFVELGPSSALKQPYFVSYVYHCEENGPVAGYGFGCFPGPSRLNEKALQEIQHSAVVREQMTRNITGLKETIKSLSLISVQKL